MSNTIWLISVETRHGTDVVLIRQEKEPTNKELKQIEDKFQHDYDLEANACTECGCRDFDMLPTSVKDFIENDIQ